MGRRSNRFKLLPPALCGGYSHRPSLYQPLPPMDGIKLLTDLFANVPDVDADVGRAGEGRIAEFAPPPAPPPPTEGRTPTVVERGNAALRRLRGFIGGIQLEFVKDLLRGEEGSFFADKLTELAGIVEAIPSTGETDGQGSSALAHLHYFAGGQANWYITEKDKGCAGDRKDGVPPQSQAFGLADLFGDGGELGYISIAEILANNGELDFHWKPQTLEQIRNDPDQATTPPEPKPTAVETPHLSGYQFGTTSDNGLRFHEFAFTRFGVSRRLLAQQAAPNGASATWVMFEETAGNMRPAGAAHNEFSALDWLLKQCAALGYDLRGIYPGDVTLNEVLTLFGMQKEKVGSYWHVTKGDETICRTPVNADDLWRELCRIGWVDLGTTDAEVHAETEVREIESSHE